MDIVSILLVFSFILLITSFVNQKVAAALNVAFFILIPYTFTLQPFGIPFSVKYLCVFVYLFLQISIYRNKISITPIKPFIILYISLLILIPFQTGVPHEHQIGAWLRYSLPVIIFPFILWDGSQKESSYLKYYHIVLVVSTIIACIYGIICTFVLDGDNPYQMILNVSQARDMNSDWYFDTDRIFGRSQSTFSYPLTWGAFLVLAFSCFFILSIKSKKYSSYLYYFIVILILINAVICGVRSCFLSIFIYIVLYLVLSKKIKILITGVCSIGLIFVIIAFVKPELIDFTLSVFDPSSKGVEGSSLEMRIRQFLGCFDIIKDNLLFGQGFSYVDYYSNNYGLHPVLYGFESVIYSILCESGIIGAVIWVIFYINLLKLNRKLLQKEDIFLFDIFVITYFCYTLFTGSYFFMQYFSMICIYLLTYFANRYKNQFI